MDVWRRRLARVWGAGVWGAGVLAGLMLASSAIPQTAPTPSQSQPKSASATPTSTTQNPSAATSVQQSPQTSKQQPALTTSPPTTPASPAQPATPRPAPHTAIVLDPAHGGGDRGTALTDKLKEKDVVLALARRVRGELTRAGVQVTMLRDSDVTLDTDQRAQMANGSRPLLYISLHASSIGSGVRIYTSVMPEVQPAPGNLVRWQRAQQDSLDASHAAAESLAADLGDRSIVATTLGAPLPPLNSVTAPAIAVEIAPPPSGKTTADMLGLPQYQQRIAAALAAALVNARKKIGQAQ